MSTFALRGIHAAILVGLLGCGLAGAQDYPPDLKAALIASPESSKTVQLKDGRILTFRQLVELPEPEREELLELSKKRSAHANFLEWVNAAAEAKAEEAHKSLAAAEAEGRRLDKELAAAVAEGAKSFESLAKNTRSVLAAGVKLPISFSTFSKSVAIINDDYLKAGLSKEDADFLKSLLKRPELFARP